MIYDNINNYNCNLIINYLNDLMGFKMHTLFKYLEYKELDNDKIITLAIDGKCAYLLFNIDNTIKLKYENTYENKIFTKIDMDLLRDFLIIHFRDKTIEKIINHA